MASGDHLLTILARSNPTATWLYVLFTGGSTEPSLGDTIWGDLSDANAVLEYLVLNSGTWGGGDAAGYMILSNHDGTTWTSGEDFTANTTTAGNHGTFTAVPVANFASPDTPNCDPSLDFDEAVNEVAVFAAVMPEHYGGNGLTVTLGLTAGTVTGDMSFAVFLKAAKENVGNIHDVGLDPSGLKTYAAPQVNQAIDAATSVGTPRHAAITFTSGAQMDSIVAGDLFYILVMRDVQDGTNDDMSGDATLKFIRFVET